ncbi:endothelin-converting enzyme homolog [Ornithodoros turicata]|uniref:endothelin-converting enzyme homolog n=1 Tax=Ornithodoros turicata TaxID=34597 RepID=UPI003139F535
MSTISRPGGIVIYTSAICFAVVTVTAITVVLLKTNPKRAQPLDSEPYEEPIALEKEACSTAACADASKQLVRTISQEIAPCHNFYRFVCDGWERTHPPKDNIYLRSVLAEAENNVKKMLMLALESAPVPRRNQSQIDKITALYRSCTSSQYTEGNSMKSIGRFLKVHYQNWPELDVPDIVEFFDYVLELDIRWRLNIMFRYELHEEANRQMSVVLKPYKPPILAKNVRPAYMSLVQEVARMIGGDHDGNYVDLAAAVLSFETKLSEMPLDTGYVAIQWTKILTIFPGTTYQMWLEPFAKYHHLGNRIRATSSVYIYSPLYFKSFVALLFLNAHNGSASWYVNWRFIQSLGCRTSYEFRQLTETQLLWPSGECGATDVHIYCQTLVRSLLVPQWKGLVTKVLLSPKAVHDVTDIARNLRKVLEDKLRLAVWMDATTRMRAFSKLKSLKEELPRLFIFDAKEPDFERYSRIPDMTPSFVDNWLALRQALGLLVENVTRTYQLDFSVHYDNLINVLHVNVDVLTRPVYSYGVPVTLNYAGLGTMIVREYTRAFDWAGGQIDGSGRSRRWWTNDTLKNYQQRAQCFAAQLRQFINDTKDLAHVLPDVVATSSGLRLAFFALEAAMQESHKMERLQGVDLSSPQLFFTSFCYHHCQNVGQLSNVIGVKFGDTSLGEILCNVATRNMLEFSDAFGCSVNDKMYSPSRCRIW